MDPLSIGLALGSGVLGLLGKKSAAKKVQEERRKMMTANAYGRAYRNIAGTAHQDMPVPEFQTTGQIPLEALATALDTYKAFAPEFRKTNKGKQL